MKALIVSLESFQKGEIPEEVKRYLVANKGNVFTVLDESSKIKTNEPCKETKKSKRTQAVLQLGRLGQRCILTGTFMSKSPVNAYDQMNFLCPNFFSENIYAFASRYRIEMTLQSQRGVRVLITEKVYRRVYTTLANALKRSQQDYVIACQSIYGYFGINTDSCDHIVKHPEYSPFKHLDELWGRIGDNCLKVERKDLYDLPPKIYRKVPVALTAEQKKLYLQLQNQYCTDHITVDNGLKLYLRFQDVCNGYEPVDHGDTIDEKGKVHHNVELVPLKQNPKLDALMDCIEEIGSEQVVVWCSRTKLLYDAKALLDEAGYTTGVFDGKVGTEAREADYNAFAEKRIQILLANQGSGAYGLDKLKEADYAVYLCSDYSVEHRQQSEDRIYRGEVKRNKTIIDISMVGTVEDRVTEALKLGKELLDTGTTDASLFMLDEKELSSFVF